MGMQYGLIAFERLDDSIRVKRVLGKQKFGKIFVEQTEEESLVIAQVPAEMDTVYVKYRVKRNGTRDLNESEKGFPCEIVTFFYSFDGEEYHEVLLMESVPGRWVGVKYGLFCISSALSSSGSVTVTEVRMERQITFELQED